MRAMEHDLAPGPVQLHAGSVDRAVVRGPAFEIQACGDFCAIGSLWGTGKSNQKNDGSRPVFAGGSCNVVKGRPRYPPGDTN